METMKATATCADKKFLDGLYENRRALHGELHDHANTGGTSDGTQDLAHWRADMERLHIDFVAILDHRQVRHMYLPEWEDGVFIAGTEPGTHISDSKAKNDSLHYNLIFENPKQVEKLISRFPEYQFTGGVEGHFIYPKFTTERFGELIDAVKEEGGFFVIPHPKQIMVSDDPLDYWFRDGVGIEAIYYDLARPETTEDYALWVDLLAAGKKVWATAGGDWHADGRITALTTMYAEGRKNKYYLKHLRMGDFVAGPVGIRMCMGDTPMGGTCDFAGKRLIFSVGDFHEGYAHADHKYHAELLDDKGTVMTAEVRPDTVSYFAIDAKDCKFYRVEVFDDTLGLRIAIGNPIWKA